MALLTNRDTSFLAASMCTTISVGALAIYGTRRIMPQSPLMTPKDMAAFAAHVVKLDPSTAQQVFARVIEVEKNAVVRAEIEQTCADGTLPKMDAAITALRARTTDAARADNHTVFALTRDGALKRALFVDAISNECVGADSGARGDPMVLLSIPTVRESSVDSLIAMLLPILEKVLYVLGAVALLEEIKEDTVFEDKNAVATAVHALSLVAEYHHTLVRWGDPFVLAIRVRRPADLPPRTPGLLVHAELEKVGRKRMEKFIARVSRQQEETHALRLALVARARDAPPYAREQVEAEFEKHTRAHPAIPLDLPQPAAAPLPAETREEETHPPQPPQ